MKRELKWFAAMICCGIIALGIMSCSKSDDDPAGGDGSLVGKWEVVETNFDILDDAYIVFYDGGDMKVIFDDYYGSSESELGRYSVSGKNLTIEVHGSTIKGSLSFINDNHILYRFNLDYDSGVEDFYVELVREGYDYDSSDWDSSSSSDQDYSSDILGSWKMVSCTYDWMVGSSINFYSGGDLLVKIGNEKYDGDWYMYGSYLELSFNGDNFEGYVSFEGNRATFEFNYYSIYTDQPQHGVMHLVRG